jgi:hypothetical protein
MITRTSVLIAAVVTLIAGCSRHDTRSAPSERDVAKHPVLGAATQADLARELDQAERRGTWRELKQRWEGQRLHWTVTRQRQLCQSPAACNVAPFAIRQAAQYGWMPALEMTSVQYTKLASACGDAEQCQVELEFTMRELDVSGDLPTSMKFSDVKVIRAHAS